MEQLEFWHWLIFGFVMICIEMILPAVYFLWTGISAIIIGLLLLAMPSIPLLIQVIIFGVLSVMSVVMYKRYQLANPREKAQPNLNKRGQQYVDRLFTLDEPIVNGVGKIKVDDSTWKVTGIDLPAGSKVRVVSVEGTILQVEEVTTMFNSNE
ncbi:MAG: NfeD family protein [Pseudomonadota bacterium]